MYSFRRYFFPGFPALTRVSAVGAFPIAVVLSSSTSVSNVTGVQKTFLLFLAFLLLLAYLLAKVSAVAWDPVVTVALLRCTAV